MRLTPAQQEAISHTSGNLQIVACAGSGKTEVIAQHIAHLLDRNRAGRPSPHNIVAFTFTEKAAKELEDRIVSRCYERHGDGHGLGDLYVGTIHSFCLDLLRNGASAFQEFNVLNAVQQALLIDLYHAESGLTVTTDLEGVELERYRDTRDRKSVV